LTEVHQAETPPQDWVWLARIRRPQGRKGEVLADIFTDFPEKFAERTQLWLLKDAEESGNQSAPASGVRHTASGPAAPRKVELTSHWLHKGSIVLHFAGVDSISDAEALAGLVVAVPIEERAALAEDEVYIGDLIGCTLIDIATAEPVAVGAIEDVDRTAGPVPLLVVAGAAGEVLIPFAKAYLRKLDVAAKRVEMALPAGLVELNAAREADPIVEN
jgi:16S rRNA processing protein RimM